MRLGDMMWRHHVKDTMNKEKEKIFKRRICHTVVRDTSVDSVRTVRQPGSRLE